MKKLFWSAGAAALSLAAAMAVSTAANAAIWTSQLEYKSAGTPLTAVSPSFGTVTLNETDANDVRVTVTLNAGYSLFLDTGNATNHQPFSFNLLDTPDSTVTVITPNSGLISYDAVGTYSQPPFGDFTNALACASCNGAHGVPPPIVFNVFNASGITFAGVGATFDGSGKLLTLGTGNHFVSNTGGWWFAADIYQTAPGCGDACTFDVAARDAFTGGVPEPATWGLMILGLGGVGGILRRRRSATAFA